MLRVKLSYDSKTKYNVVKVENDKKEIIEMKAFSDAKAAFKEVEQLNNQLTFKIYGK